MDTPPLLYKSVHVTFVFWVPKTPPTPYMSGTFVLAPPPRQVHNYLLQVHNHQYTARGCNLCQKLHVLCYSCIYFILYTCNLLSSGGGGGGGANPMPIYSLQLLGMGLKTVGRIGIGLKTVKTYQFAVL